MTMDADGRRLLCARGEGGMSGVRVCVIAMTALVVQ